MNIDSAPSPNPQPETSAPDKVEVTLGRMVIGALCALPGAALNEEVIHAGWQITFGVIGGGAISYAINRARSERHRSVQ